MRACNQGTQCKYEDFADELTRDQFKAGLTSEAAKSFEATTYANQLMKIARGNQEQVNMRANRMWKRKMSYISLMMMIIASHNNACL